MDSQVINSLGKQRAYSQHITKLALVVRNSYIDSGALDSYLQTLEEAKHNWEQEYEQVKFHFVENGAESDVALMFTGNQVYFDEMQKACNEIGLMSKSTRNVAALNKTIEKVLAIEPIFYSNVDAMVLQYQKETQRKIGYFKRKIYVLAILAFLILIGQFLFIIKPNFRVLEERNHQLGATNVELKKSYERLNVRLDELNKLKLELEAKEGYLKVFIEQSPSAIAMLDSQMCYIAVSKQWIKDYRLDGIDIIGKSHYEIFPEISEEWKQIHKECLDGAVDVCDGAPFSRKDGAVNWIAWDVRPWYNSDKEVGGLLMLTKDLTEEKARENERDRIVQILDRTNEIARIGTWEVNLVSNSIFWSKLVKEIHEVDEDYKPDLETAIEFFKEGESRDRISQAVTDAIEHGIPYDIELELVTNKGNTVWVRAIGQAEFFEKKCLRIYGLFQDINAEKESNLALNKAHSELNAILNSGPIAIIGTNSEGEITHFNKGAEQLTGYSSSEMMQLPNTHLYHLHEDLVDFNNEYNQGVFDKKNPFSGFLMMNKSDMREWTFVRKDGAFIPVNLTLTPLKGIMGETNGLLAVATDISDIRNSKKELIKRNQLLSFAERIAMMGNWSWDTITNNVTWSTNLYNIFEIEETDNLTYDTYYEFVHPEDKALVADHVERAIREKKFDDLSHRIKLRNGKVKIIQLLAEVVTDEQGNIIELIGTCQDITQQNMAERKFRGLLESAPDAMVIVNETGKIQLVNKQAEKLFGYSAEEIRNKPVDSLIPMRFKENHMRHSLEYFQNPNTRSMGEGQELFGISKNGEEIPIQISLSPLKTEEGLLVSAAIRDITEQKLVQSKIIKNNKELELLTKNLTKRNAQLADFAQITSHNLRAPVSNLNSLLGIYHKTGNQADKEFIFEKFESVTNHLTSTLDTLVEALRTKEEGPKALEEVKFQDVLDLTKKIFVGELIKTNTKIKSNFEELTKVAYYRPYLESIFLNLIGNAIKYRREDSVPEIYIKSQNRDGILSLSFKDNGLGIDMNKHGHKLFGLNKVFHRHPDAKGVGLFMTKVQVEAMGGNISATSVVNEGTTFIIQFNK